jgi:hypothetical protein
LFIVFDSFSDNTYHIQFLLNAVDVQLGVGSITTVDANGLQSEQLFQDAALLTEIYDSIQFDVVTGTMEDTVLDDKLFRGNNELEFAQVQTAIEHYQCCHTSQYEERQLKRDGLVTCNKEQHKTHKEHETL